MAAVESLSVDPIDMPQTPGKVPVGGLDQEMVVVGHEAISSNPQAPESAGFLNGLEKGRVILWVSEDQFPPSSSIQDMIPSTRIFDPEGAGHGSTLPENET